MTTGSDWTKPTVTDTYSNWPGMVTGRDNDLAVALDPAIITTSYPSSGIPVGSVRFRSNGGSPNLWERWNGTAWSALAATYNISISGNSATATSAGTVSTPAQPSITSLGTLTGLTVTAPISGSITGSSASCTGNAASATNWGSYGGVPTSGAVPGPNGIPRADSNGYLFLNYLNINTSNAENPTISQVMVTNGTDGYLRKSSIQALTNAVAELASNYGTWSLNISGSSASCTGSSASCTGNAATVTNGVYTTTITGYGYQTAAQVTTAITGYGYQTAAQVTTAITGYGYQTAAQVTAATPGRLITFSIITASGTFNKQAATNTLYIEMIGGGAGGGGAGLSYRKGGAAGSVVRQLINSAASSYSVTIGGGGAGGLSGASSGAGGIGGNTVFGAYTASGGYVKASSGASDADSGERGFGISGAVAMSGNGGNAPANSGSGGGGSEGGVGGSGGSGVILVWEYA